ncbi:hypothetical protein DB346_20320 [Verrucomicrobia bacterium LW23]|nr:hypothetical protein DB346_20320 [Verrucomicrobia bacterium LW23]
MGRILFLISALGGSHAYGLSTPASDVDFRGVFLNADVATAAGLDTREHVTRREPRDESYHELRYFMQMLRKGNTGALEILFSDNAHYRHPLFALLAHNRQRFIHTVHLYKTLKGYLHSERRLANGERTGLLGARRKQQIDRLGFSPKNFVQMFRLAHCGIAVFERGVFPVDLRKDDPSLADRLLAIKATPELYTKARLNEEADLWIARLDAAFEHRRYEFTFDEALAHDVCAAIYAPVMQALYGQIAARRDFPPTLHAYSLQTQLLDFQRDAGCVLGNDEANEPRSVTDAVWPEIPPHESR